MRIARRILNTVLLVVLVVLLIGTVQKNRAATLHTSATRLNTDAAEQTDVLRSIYTMFTEDTIPIKLADSLPNSAEGCSLIDVNISLENRGTEPAEWLDVDVQPIEGDLAVYSITGEETAIAAGATGTVNLKLVTAAAPEAMRRIIIKYYVHGQLHSVTVKA